MYSQVSSSSQPFETRTFGRKRCTTTRLARSESLNWGCYGQRKKKPLPNGGRGGGNYKFVKDD